MICSFGPHGTGLLPCSSASSLHNYRRQLDCKSQGLCWGWCFWSVMRRFSFRPLLAHPASEGSPLSTHQPPVSHSISDSVWGCALWWWTLDHSTSDSVWGCALWWWTTEHSNQPMVLQSCVKPGKSRVSQQSCWFQQGLWFMKTYFLQKYSSGPVGQAETNYKPVNFSPRETIESYTSWSLGLSCDYES